MDDDLGQNSRSEKVGSWYDKVDLANEEKKNDSGLNANEESYMWRNVKRNGAGDEQ